jgi:hypothetical protein
MSAAELAQRLRAGGIPGLNEDQIPRWRFDALRASSVDALRLASSLLAHQEGTFTMDKDDFYHTLVELNRALSSGIFEGTKP